MKKYENQFYAIYFGVFALIFIFFIIRGVADIVNNGISLMKVVSILLFSVLVFNLARCVVLFYKKAQKLNLK
jgi:hypothetical protein